VALRLHTPLVLRFWVCLRMLDLVMNPHHRHAKLSWRPS